MATAEKYPTEIISSRTYTSQLLRSIIVRSSHIPTYPCFFICLSRCSLCCCLVGFPPAFRQDPVRMMNATNQNYATIRHEGYTPSNQSRIAIISLVLPADTRWLHGVVALSLARPEFGRQSQGGQCELTYVGNRECYDRRDPAVAENVVKTRRTSSLRHARY